MKKDILALLAVLTLMAVIVVLLFSSRIFTKPDITVFADTVEAIGTVSYLDTEYEEEVLGYEHLAGGGKFVADDGAGTIQAIYIENGEMCMIEISYELQFLSERISIDSVDINYVSREKQLYTNVLFSGENSYKSFLTSEGYTDYLETLDIPLIIEYLKTCPLLEE